MANIMTKPYPVGGAARVAYGTEAPTGALNFAVHLEVVADVRERVAHCKFPAYIPPSRCFEAVN